MTQEEKQLLLLKDLCARLPYGVKIEYLYWNEDKGCEYPVPMILDDINSDGYIRFHGDIEEGEGRGYILTYLPYLRPLSSMTIEEQKEVNNLLGYRKTINGFGDIRCAGWNGDTFVNISIIDKYINWLNTHHFDYRRLIEKGLALEAPEGMYKIK